MLLILTIVTEIPLCGAYALPPRQQTAVSSGTFATQRTTSKLNSASPRELGENELDLLKLPPGLTPGFYITSSYPPNESIGYRRGPTYGSNVVFDSRPKPERTSPENVTLPLALMILDPSRYPSLSSARKVCRKGNVILVRGNSATAEGSRIRGRVGDRVCPDDGIYIQTRLSDSFYPSLTYAKPAFELGVLYEDDEMAIVNKPGGVVTYSHKKGGWGRMTVRAALPYVLKPPRQRGKEARQILRRPLPVHRLDKATSGVMVVAKSKGAMRSLSEVRNLLSLLLLWFVGGMGMGMGMGMGIFAFDFVCSVLSHSSDK